MRWFKGGRLGAEAFATNPDFYTEMRTFVPFEIGLTETTLAGLTNNTIFWDLVQDNEDGDRYPDKRAGNLQGQPNDREDEDIDGVFPGQDDDNDGLPDTNRNFNDVPDYVEPFLMYYVESKRLLLRPRPQQQRRSRCARGRPRPPITPTTPTSAASTYSAS